MSPHNVMWSAIPVVDGCACVAKRDDYPGFVILQLQSQKRIGPLIAMHAHEARKLAETLVAFAKQLDDGERELPAKEAG